MIRAVIFDCFGVLYADPGLVFYQREVADFARLQSAILDIDKQFDYGFIDEHEHARAVAKLTGLDSEFVRTHVRGEHARNQELVDFSQSLRPRYKIGMLSNIGHGGMASFFSDQEQAELFDAVVLSSDVGMIKPSQEIFRLTAEKLDCRPEECIMIDDRQDNVDGARLAGMGGVYFKNNQQCIADIQMIMDQNNA